MCRRVEEIRLLRTHHKRCEDRHVDRKRFLPSTRRCSDKAEIWGRP